MPKPAKAAQPYAALQNVAGLFALTRGAESPSFEIAASEPERQTDSASSSTAIVALDDITVSNRIRQYLDTEKTESLARSIRQYGFRGVLWVRRVDSHYQLVAGGRRYAACQMAGITEVSVEIWDISDAEAVQLELLENFQREDLNPIEEAEGVLRMLEVTLELERSDVISLLGRMSRRGKSNNSEHHEHQDNVILTPNEVGDNALYQQVEEVFRVIGRYSPESFRTHRLPLLNLPDSLVTAISKGELEYTKARAIARIKDQQSRDDVLAKAIEEGLSHIEIGALIKRVQADTQSAVEPLPERRVYDRAQGVTKRIRAAKLGGRELKKVEKLLSQLEELLGLAEAN